MKKSIVLSLIACSFAFASMASTGDKDAKAPAAKKTETKSCCKKGGGACCKKGTTATPAPAATPEKK